MNKAIAIARVLVRKKGNNNNFKPNKTKSVTEEIYRDGLIVVSALSAFILTWGFICLVRALFNGGINNLAKHWLTAITGM